MDLFGQIGVVWFTLISAYFLTERLKTLSSKRIVKLWAEVYLYSIFCFAAAVFWIWRSGSPVSDFLNLGNCLMVFLPVIFNEYWFVGAYIIMICLAPFVNILLDNLNYKKTFQLIFILIFVVFIWKILNPKSGYYTDYMYLLSVYVIGATVSRYYDKLPKIGVCALAVVVAACWMICVVATYAVRSDLPLVRELGFSPNAFWAGGGASPILSVVSGVVSFLFVLRHIRASSSSRGGVLSRVVLNVAPASLGIYLIHTNPFLGPLLFGFIYEAPEPSGLASKILEAVVGIALIFVVSILLSICIYKLLVSPIDRLIDKRYDKKNSIR